MTIRFRCCVPELKVTLTMPCDLDTAVIDWVIEHPETLAVFQRLGIDYTCGGKSLAFACRERGLEPESVLAMLHRTIETSG